MQIAIALHQSCWLRLSMSRMILRGDRAAEKQPEYDAERIFHCSYPPENLCKLLCTAMAARAYRRVWFDIMPAANSPPPRLCAGPQPFRFSAELSRRSF